MHENKRVKDNETNKKAGWKDRREKQGRQAEMKSCEDS